MNLIGCFVKIPTIIIRVSIYCFGVLRYCSYFVTFIKFGITPIYFIFCSLTKGWTNSPY